ncbi:MAG: hypothetical protein WAL95_03560 [Candidatus Acidiferrales bacterium]
MKFRLILVLCAATVVLGCDVRASLYPVQGPLFKQSPAVTYAAKIEGFNGPGRAISVNYRDGEILTGNWEIVPGARASKGAAATSVPASGNLSADWDAVYGPGFYSGHVLGQTYERAVLKGNHGTVMTVELYRREDIRGVARDGQGNVFKVVVY